MVAAYNFSGDVHMAHESTADDGYFRIDGVHNGSYIVGAAGENRVVAMMGQNVTVKDADVTDVLVELDAGATLSGRVEPPSAAHIGLDMDTSTIGLGNFTQAISAAVVSCQAQDDGTFTLKGVPDGSFSLVAEAADGSRGHISVKVSNGADQGGLVLRMKGRGSIAGVVVDPSGQPVEGVRVAAETDSGQSSLFDTMSQIRGAGEALTDKDGRFKVVGLADGTQKVSVKDGKGVLAWADPAHQKDDATRPIEVRIADARPVTGLRLVVEARDKVIGGVVLGPDGQPVADAWVTARRHRDLSSLTRVGGKTGGDDKGGDDKDGNDRGGAGNDQGGAAHEHTVTVTVGSGGSSVDESSPAGSDAAAAKANNERRMRRWSPAEDPVLTGEDGRFEIHNLRDTPYDLDAEGLKGEARGSIDQVAAGRRNLVIRLKTLASVTGHVTQAGKPVTDYLIRGEGPMARDAHVLDARGDYRLTRLDPGVYNLSVVAPQGRATATVHVTANHVSHKNLDLVAYGAVHGVLVDARTGTPMVGMPVAAFAEGSDLGLQAMHMLSGDGPRTDSEGRFRIERLGSGDGTVMAIDGDKGGFEIVARRSFTLAPGQDLDLGTLQGQSVNLVPKDQRGDLGMQTTAATWADSTEAAWRRGRGRRPARRARPQGDAPVGLVGGRRRPGGRGRGPRGRPAGERGRDRCVGGGRRAGSEHARAQPRARGTAGGAGAGARRHQQHGVGDAAARGQRRGWQRRERQRERRRLTRAGANARPTPEQRRRAPACHRGGSAGCASPRCSSLSGWPWPCKLARPCSFESPLWVFWAVSFSWPSTDRSGPRGATTGGSRWRSPGRSCSRHSDRWCAGSRRRKRSRRSGRSRSTTPPGWSTSDEPTSIACRRRCWKAGGWSRPCPTVAPRASRSTPSGRVRCSRPWGCRTATSCGPSTINPPSRACTSPGSSPVPGSVGPRRCSTSTWCATATRSASWRWFTTRSDRCGLAAVVATGPGSPPARLSLRRAAVAVLVEKRHQGPHRIDGGEDADHPAPLHHHDRAGLAPGHAIRHVSNVGGRLGGEDLGGHGLAHRDRLRVDVGEALDEREIALRHDADQPAPLQDRQVPDAVMPHDAVGRGQCLIAPNGVRTGRHELFDRGKGAHRSTNRARFPPAAHRDRIAGSPKRLR